MSIPGVILFEYPVTDGDDPKALQVNWVPAIWEVSVMFVKALSQIVFEGGEFERSGTG
jgi:hypothetical protein